MNKSIKRFDFVPAKFERQIKTPRIRPYEDYSVVVVHGSPGVGKTHEACSFIFGQIIAGNASTAAFLMPTHLLRWISDPPAHWKGQATVDALRDYDILLIDDLFTSERHWQEPLIGMLRDVIVQRIDNNRKTIITTNRGQDIFQDHLDTGLASRLLDPKRREAIWTELEEKRFNEKDLGENFTLAAVQPAWLFPATIILNTLYDCHLEQERDTFQSWYLFNSPILDMGQNDEAENFIIEHCTAAEWGYYTEVKRCNRLWLSQFDEKGEWLPGMDTDPYKIPRDPRKLDEVFA